MPRGDGTGPAGLGPMTGRAAGYCAGYSVPGYLNPVPGRAWYGRGGGRGWRNLYYATGLPGWARAQMGYPAWGGAVYPPAYSPYGPEMAPQQEAEILKNRAKLMQDEINALNERIKEIEKIAKKKEEK